MLITNHLIFIGSATPFMNSIERHQKRYERRKLKRDTAKAKRNEHHTFLKVSSFGALRRSYYKAKKSVGWKASVQRYGINVLFNSYIYSNRIRNGENISRGFIEFDINERGKKRHIQSVHISERVVQKSLCDYGIVPVIEKSLIHDNGASQRGKGTHFASVGLIKDLREYYRKHGNKGYILLGDCSNFFGSLNHNVIEKNLNLFLTDKKLIDFTMGFINAFDNGLGLGSQVNQICAVSYQNRIDHYIKETLKCKWYGRYMDDWYILCDSKAKLKEMFSEISLLYENLGIHLNKQKTYIAKISRKFQWLQDKYLVTEKGKVIRKANRKNTTRNRRKLKKLARLLDCGKIPYSSVRDFYASYRGYMKYKNGYTTKKNMDKLYNQLIIERWDYVKDNAT